MAISTNSEIHTFGTTDAIDDGTTASIASDAISVAADVTAWTNDDDVTEAVMIGNFTWGTAPTINSRISIIARLLNIDGASDAPAPEADYPETEIGSFVCNNGATTQVLTAEVSLPNAKSSQEYEFYLINRTGQTISANWDLDITPRAYALHA